MEIRFNIPNEKAQSIVDAMKGLNPIPLNEAGEPLFTDAQWAKECLRRWVVTQEQRWRRVQAEGQLQTDPDDTIIT